MIAATGVDLVSIPRLAKVRGRHGERFLRKVFTEDESSECLKRALPDQGLAGRFAAKEAALKALGTGWAMGIGWKDVEVRKSDGGRPVLALHGQAATAAAALGVKSTHLSLSHDGDYAVAFVVFEK